ncbi:MAG: hypothetical protein ACK46I_16625 [Phycisphaerae bacterium]|jgi:hypothetical protein
MASEQESNKRGPLGDEAAEKADDLEQQVEALLRDVEVSEKTLTATMNDEQEATDIDAAALEAAMELEQEATEPANTANAASTDATDAPVGDEMGSLVDELLASVNSTDATTEIPAANPDVVASVPDDVAPAAEAEVPADATSESAAAESVTEELVTTDANAEAVTPDALDAASVQASASSEPAEESIPAMVSEATGDAASEAAPAASLDALDAQIAASADEELANATPAQLLGVPETALAEALVKPTPAVKAPEPTHAKTEVKQAEPKHAGGRDVAKEKAKQAAGWLGHALEPYVAKLAELSAKPLANRPKSVKSAAAMIAANTTLFAAVFWGYLLFFRPTQPAAAQAEPFDFKTSGLPSPERHDEHGEAHAAAGGHGEAKGGGDHGDAKGGKDAAKPIIESRPKHLLNEVESERAKASTGGQAEAKKGGH